MRSKRMVAMVLVAVVLLAIVTCLGPATRDASADLGSYFFGKLFKLGGIILVVDHYGGSINAFINRFLSQEGCPLVGKSKVVPIIKVLSGVAVGGAQIVGPPAQVDKVQAVAEVQLGAGGLRGRALIPVTARKDLTSSVQGVGGVGVSAEVVFPL